MSRFSLDGKGLILQYASRALICGLALMVAGCVNLDPTDPSNVSPITVVNDTQETVGVAWCADDGSSCREQRRLGNLRPGSSGHYQISSYEVVFRLGFKRTAEMYLCRDNAPGSLVKVSDSTTSLKSAYDSCGTG